MLSLGRTGLSNVDSNISGSHHSNAVYRQENFFGSRQEDYGRKSLFSREAMSENVSFEADFEKTSCNDYHIKKESRDDNEYIDMNLYLGQHHYSFHQENPITESSILRAEEKEEEEEEEEQDIQNQRSFEQGRSLKINGSQNCDRLVEVVETQNEHERKSTSSNSSERNIPQLFRPYETNQPSSNFKILKPDEINSQVLENPTTLNLIEQTELKTRQKIQTQIREKEKYHILKQQLSRGPNVYKNLPALTKLPLVTTPNETEHSINKVSDDSVLYLSHFNVDERNHPYSITEELVDDLREDFSPEDLTLRYHVIVFLWVLLGERRLMKAGYPSDSIHLVLWRIVHVCCSVAGVKSAAAVPLPENHNCGTDMLCFRDHVHRFLEVCAPTRDLWKQFGWASLTVEAVMRKIYKGELLYTLLKHVVAIPEPIKMAMQKLATLEREENDRQFAAAETLRNPQKWQKIPKPSHHMANKSNIPMSYYRPILPKPPEKKKRGRPVKIKKNLPETGRIQRVMLWRFIMNLLEEPGNAACIHWVKREEGIFRILNTDWLARIWGRRHGNPRMTYEKMARAMRTYYRSKVLQPVPRTRNLPRKLVYKFNPALIKKIPVNN